MRTLDINIFNKQRPGLMKVSYGFLMLFLISNVSFSQIDSNKFVKYTPDFKFKDGVFLNIDQVKSNEPIPASRIVSSMDYNDKDFFDVVLSKNVLYYYDNVGTQKELPTSKVWGYSRNGYLYIKIEGDYYRITLIGAISHFLANHTTYNSSSPYYNSYSDPYQMGSSYPTTEVEQYLLDFMTGRVMDYSVKNIETLLMQDPALHDEYDALSNKKKQQQKFVFMRKFNESHPLFFPKN